MNGGVRVMVDEMEKGMGVLVEVIYGCSLNEFAKTAIFTQLVDRAATARTTTPSSKS